MAIEDIIPNVFGGVPSVYQGLLGAEDTAALQKRANLAGLLSAGAALAQGMSPQGYRRSALQNVLSAAAAGFGGAGQAYQSGIEQIAAAQKLGQSQQQIQTINQLLQDPNIDPSMKALIRANPAEGLKMLAEMQPIKQAIAGGQPTQVAPQGSPQIVQQASVGGEDALPEQVVTASKGIDYQLSQQKNNLIAENNRLSSIPSKIAQDRIKSNLDQITAIDKQLDRAAVTGFNFQAVEDAVPKQFKNRVRNLQQAAETGAISMADLTSRLQDIEKEAVAFVIKKTDYTNQDRRVAAGMFGGRSIEELNPQELMQLQAELDRGEIAKRRAGATVIDMGSREMEKEFAKGVVEDTRASFQQAKSGINTIKTVARLQPLISAGVYEGALAGAPRAIDQFATALGVSGKNTQEKLARTAQAMQGLASLELEAAGAMKGQGAITENERALIARAAGGNLRDFTAVEINSLLGALDKVARAKVEAHQSNWEIMNEDPIGRKYSKYYKIEAAPAPISTVTPAEQSAPSGVTVRKIR